METNFNFNSQIATSRIQSERLLAFGLKKETADMVHFFSRSFAQDWTIIPLAEYEIARNIQGLEIPAWSLHRLLAMLTTKRKVMLIRFEADLYDVLIDRIEREIKEGYFNKEYLEV